MTIRLSSLLAAVILICSAVVADSAPRGLPAQEGILNFGKVNENLYRGAQPDTNAILNLKRLGVKSIISLCQPGISWKMESAAAATAGLLCTNLPMSGISRPKPEQVRAVLAAIETLPGPVFIHCAHGCDRTGTIVACYRIQHDKWSVTNAMAEANRYGLSVLERGMRLYVADFGRSAQPVIERIADAKP